MIWKFLIRMFPILLLFLYPVENATAQTTTSGALTGVVTDPRKAIVPEAVVRLRDTTKGTTQATITDREGVYRFFFLPPGRYTLTVTHDGFQEATRTMEILLGSAVSVNVRLEIMKEDTTVKVMGEVPLIQAENGEEVSVRPLSAVIWSPARRPARSAGPTGSTL